MADTKAMIAIRAHLAQNLCLAITRTGNNVKGQIC